MKRLSGNKILSLFLTLAIVISALVILSVGAIEPINGDEYKSYVGSVAMFNTYSEYDVLLCDHPDNFNWDINKAILNANIPSDLKLVITDCFINTKEQLFYKVEAAPGHTLPEILNKYSWVYQNDLGISEEYDALVILSDISAIPENGDENSTVTVSGKFPSDTVLSATEYTDSSEIEEILIEADADEVLTPEYDENGNVIKKSFVMDTPYRFLDLSLMREGVEIKADGTVIVTMDAASLGLYEGDAFLVYHIHQNEDGSYEREQLGPFKVKNGKASFEMNSFSYVLVVSSTEIVSLKDKQGKYYDLHNFYPVQTYSDNLTLPIAGNGNLCLLGIYYDDLGGHILVGIPKGGNIKSDFLKYVYIDGVQYDATNFGTAGGTVSGNGVQYLVSPGKMNITQLSAMDTVTNSTKVLMDISKTTSKKLLGYIDIIVGHKIELKDGFTLSLDTKTGGNSGGNAFDIGKTLFDLDVDYAIDKTVHSIGGNTSMSGDVVTANGIIGSQNVVYEIKVTNTSETDTLYWGEIEDRLPPFVKHPVNVTCVTDGVSSQADYNVSSNVIKIPNLNANDEYIHGLRPGESISYYVEVSLNDTVPAGTYVNTAILRGESIASIEDSANIIVPDINMGLVTVNKTVLGIDNTAGLTFSFDILKNGVSVASFNLADKGTYSVQLEPGTYTVKEYYDDGQFVCNLGENGRTITVTAGGTTTVDVINTNRSETVQTGTLTLDKEVIVIDGSDPDAIFTFNVYRKNDDSSLELVKTVQMKSGDAAVSLELPYGNYVVKEENIPASYLCNGYRIDKGALVSGNGAEITINSQNRTKEVLYQNIYPVIKSGSLKIEKHLTVDAGATAPDVDFTFTVTSSSATLQSSYYSYRVYDSSNSVVSAGTVIPENGNKLTVKIKAEQYVVIDDLPENIYTVQEIDLPENFVCLSPENNMISATVVEGSVASVRFENHYPAIPPTMGQLIINKDIVSDTAEVVDGTFVFEIYDSEGNRVTDILDDKGDPLDVVRVTTTGGKGSVTVMIPSGYEYVVKEIEVLGDAFECVAPSNGTQNGVVIASGKSTSVQFVNEYTAPLANLTVNKVVNGNGAPEKTFTFEIYDANGDLYKTVTVVGTGSVFIENVPVGRYTVKEVNIPSNFTCANNTVVINVTAGGENAVTFVNEYKQKTTSLTIDKAFPNGVDYSMDVNQSFLFDVVETDSMGNVVLGGTSLSVTVHGDGEVTIEGMIVGHYYKITENKDWSWRYNDCTPSSALLEKTVGDDYIIVRLTDNAAANVVTFTNVRTNVQWLDGDSWCNNLFDTP